MRFLKNVAFGFVFLSAAISLPSISFILASLVGHWIALTTSSVIFGILAAFFLFILLVSASIELIVTLMNNLPFEP